jgi:hypothetical protein
MITVLKIRGQAEEQLYNKQRNRARGRSKKLEAAKVGQYEIKRTVGSNFVLRAKEAKKLKFHAKRAKSFFA